jgi:hypothetical protein
MKEKQRSRLHPIKPKRAAKRSRLGEPPSGNYLYALFLWTVYRWRDADAISAPPAPT